VNGEQFFGMLRRWAWLVVLCALVGSLVAFAVSWLSPSLYEASVTLRINPVASTDRAESAIYSDVRQIETYAELLRTRVVLEETIDNLQLDTNVESLRARTHAASLHDTQLIVLTAQDPDPQQAAAIANEIAEVFIAQQMALQASRYATSEETLQSELAEIQTAISQTQFDLNSLGTPTTPEGIEERSRLEAQLEDYQSSYADLLLSLDEVRQAQTSAVGAISITEPAQGARAASVYTWQIVLAGGAGGALLGAGIALWFEYRLGQTMATKAEVEALIGIPTLGMIARIDGNDPLDALITTVRPRSPVAEAYRVLQGNIGHAAFGQPAHTILITSASPLEGKSTTAANLAIAAAQSGKRTILVDGNLRRPVLHKLFQQSNQNGLSTALTAQNGDRASDYLVSTGLANLLLLPSGPLPPNPITLLESARLIQLIEDLKSQADVVFFDSPSLLPTHNLDAALLASRCDASLLVVLATSTRASSLIRAKERLAQAGARLVGIVLNSIESV
jgi:non-specific protein-tyrosine kinase